SLDAGADVNAIDNQGDTALHGAAQKGDDQVVQFLVDHGAKLDIKDKKGRTPLDAAMGLMGNGGFDGTRRDVHESTAALLRKLMAVPEAKPAQYPAACLEANSQSLSTRTRANARRMLARRGCAVLTSIVPTRILGVIPARFASSRFPGKALATIAGKPMLQHVYERASQARYLSKLIIATDDERIHKAARGSAARGLRTPPVTLGA